MKGNDLDLVSSHLTHNILHTFWHFTQCSIIYGFCLNQICNATPEEAKIYVNQELYYFKLTEEYNFFFKIEKSFEFFFSISKKYIFCPNQPQKPGQPLKKFEFEWYFSTRIWTNSEKTSQMVKSRRLKIHNVILKKCQK